MKLAGKAAIVTGASKGIGQGLAIGLAREGADVAVNYYSDEAGARATVQAIQKLDRRAFAFQADVSQSADVQRLVEATIAQFGKIDILVNNAATVHWGPFLKLTEEQWDRTLEVDLKGVFLCSQAVARHMVQQGIKGRVISLNSVCGYGAIRELAAYCSAKGGMHLLTKCMALELGPYGITVNAIGPGATVVERNLKDDPNYDATWRPFIPLGRAGQPEDMVGPVVFLASNEAAYVTGQTFYVDGGLVTAFPQP